MDDSLSLLRRAAAMLAAMATLCIALVLATESATAAVVSRESSTPGIPSGGPVGITSGPDGNLWFTEHDGNRIGRITPAGRVTEFSAGISPKSGPAGITAGPDGNLWFAEADGNRIGRITPAGAVTEFSAGISLKSAPFGVTAGPDGNLWFAEGGRQPDRAHHAHGCRDRVLERHQREQWPRRDHRRSRRQPVVHRVQREPDRAHHARRGRDRVLRRHEPEERPKRHHLRSRRQPVVRRDRGNRIGRITPAGLVTEFSSGISPKSRPGGITPGPDGNLWFTEYDGNRIGRITPAGRVTEFPAGIAGGNSPARITAGPDGNLWFTQYGGNGIGRITPVGLLSEFPPAATIVAARLRGIAAVAVQLRCPRGAAAACRGTVWLTLQRPLNAPPGKSVGRRHFRIAPGRRATVVVPLSSEGRRRLSARRKLPLSVLLVPSAPRLYGVIQSDVVLKLRQGFAAASLAGSGGP